MVRQVDKSINDTCSSGGFKSLQVKLLKGEDTECQTCLTLLREHGFDKEQLERCVEDRPFKLFRVQPAVQHSGQQDEEVAEPSEPENAEADNQEPPAKQPAKQPASFDSAVPQDWRSFVAGHPEIELLAPGTFGKALPYRCSLCVTKRWPTGKVGDLCEPKLNTVKHFLSQHLSSETHKKNARTKENFGIDPEEQGTIDCGGIHIDDPAAARCLHKFRPEVELWLSHTNFESGFRRHSYSKPENSNTWHVRSGTCEKKVERNARTLSLYIWFTTKW